MKTDSRRNSYKEPKRRLIEAAGGYAAFSGLSLATRVVPLLFILVVVSGIAFPRCDFVLVTHAHWDHLMDVPDVVLNTGATALGSANTCQLLALLGVAPEPILALVRTSAPHVQTAEMGLPTAGTNQSGRICSDG